MRSHWAFPFERLYQAVMRAASHCNRKHIVQSVINTLSNVSRHTTYSEAVARRKVVIGKPILDPSADVELMLQCGWRNLGTYIDKYGSIWSQFDDAFVLVNGDGPSNTNCCRLVAILQTKDKRRTVAVFRHMEGIHWTGNFPDTHFSYAIDTLVLKQTMFVAEFDRDGLNYSIVQIAKYVDQDGLFVPQSNLRNIIVPFCGHLPY